GGARAGRRIRFEDTDLPRIQDESPDCKYVLPELGQGGVRVHSDLNAGAFTVTGSTPAFSEVRTIEVGEGRFYNSADVAQTRRVAFLGTDVRKQLFAGRDAIGETVFVGDVPYQVIGVMKTKEQDSSYDGMDVNKVYVPYSAMREDFPNKPPDTSYTLDRL